MSDFHTPETTEPTDARCVLLKPGDLLVLGNVGEMPYESVETLQRALSDIKDVLGFAGVVIFEQDVTVQSIEERVFKQFREGSRD